MLALLLALTLAPAADPLRFADGDRVVLVGGTLIEREQKYGRWEEALHAANAPRNFTLRNLGWSGDTVAGESRGSFDPPPKGYERLVAAVKSAEPTVVVVSYGVNESFAGEAGVEKFRAGLTKLLDDLAPTKARVVLLTPAPFEPSPGAPDAAARNTHLAKYVRVLDETAKARNFGIVDLFSRIQASGQKFTANGLHLDDDGYRRTAEWLFAKPFTAPDAPKLRAAVVAKNRLFFYRWRPQNETYLFGFRKHEQGKNGAEIPQFDPLVEKAEAEIAELVKTLPAGPLK
jgi:lysophospholipase L1-like esterase